VNLTTLCKYAVLRRLTGASIVDVLTLLRLSGVDPIAAAATPDSALALLDARDAVAGLGMSVSDADQLLSGPTGTPADDLQKEAAALLDTARSANLAILNESTVTPDHRSVLLFKILTDFNWDSARIADVSSVTHLGLSWDNYQAPLAALPVGTALPALITLDANAQLLMASVTVRPTALRAALAPLLVNATGALRTALTTLDQQAADRETELALLQTLLREKTPQTFTTDWSIPASVPLAIPAEWQGRFYYERAAGKLCFVGWMSPGDQAALIQLGPSLNVGMSVPTFDAAINALFDQSRQYVPSAINGLVVRQPAAGLTVETLLLDTTGLQDRCGLLLDRLLPDWRLSQQRAKLRDALADSVSCPPESADALLSLSITVATAGGPVQKSGFDWLAQDALLASDPVTATTRAAFPDTFDAGAQLLVLGQLVTKLALDAARVPWLRGSWTGLELKQLPTTRITGTRADLWTALGALSKLATLKKNRNLDVTALPDVLSASNQPAIDYASLADTLDGTEANLRDLAAARALNINSSPWLRDPLQLAQLVKCLDLCREMRIPAALLVSVGRAQALARPLSEAEGEARSLRQVALSGSSRGSWPDDEKSVLDQIRQRRRDASVEYLVQSRQVRDANDLYGYYLIDPQMGPCMETSRIVQAISSVQLFIQRAFMGLEPGVPAASLDKQQWSWMKNYRVWEANRKVLLYAENWIAPELRDDKTPFFDDVVSALQQGDATSAKAEAAVQTFLEKLTDFSKMEIVATCSSYDDENRLLLSHVFRTHAL
jgi:hypothetical protein